MFDFSIVTQWIDSLLRSCMSDTAEDIMNSFKTLVGGELTSYNEMMEEARELATKRMVEAAQQMGADAIVTVRYNSSSVAQGAAEVMAYGTAVRFV